MASLAEPAFLIVVFGAAAKSSLRNMVTLSQSWKSPPRSQLFINRPTDRRMARDHFYALFNPPSEKHEEGIKRQENKAVEPDKS